MTVVMCAARVRDEPALGLVLPQFANPAAWIAVASGLSTLRITTAEGPAGRPALCLDYDFGRGTGFVVARHEVRIDLPEAWEVRFFARSRGSANSLEIKFVDELGTSVWRWTLESMEAADWTELRVASSDFAFAWGPAGGGSIASTSAIEVGVVAMPGGAGSVQLAGFQVVDRSLLRAARIDASSETPQHRATHALDDDPATSWQSAGGAGPQTLTVDFGEARDIGGLVVSWHPDLLPHAFRIDVSGDAQAAQGAQGPQRWSTAYDAPVAVPATSFVPLASLRARCVRVVATPASGAGGVGVVKLDVRPVEWSRTPSEFLTNVARELRRGAWPRYLLREQTYWTPLATPRSGPLGLMNHDGAVEVGEAGFLLEPSLLLADGPDGAPRWVTWADVDTTVRLESSPLPVPTVQWRVGELSLETTAIVEDGGDEDVLLVRYRLGNGGSQAARATVLVAIRALQVTPPWQAFRSFGGPSPIHCMEWKDGQVLVHCERDVDAGGTDSDRTRDVRNCIRVTPLVPCRGFGAAGFDEGGLATELARGLLPVRSRVSDASGWAEGVLAWDLDVTAGRAADLFVECRMPRQHRSAVASGAAAAVVARPDVAGDTTHRPLVDSLDPAARLAAALEDWQRVLPLATVSGPPGALLAYEGAATSIAHILACRDVAALQPGPRRYSRSWIRDGAIMASALLRARQSNAAQSFVRWYAPFQYENGFVPSCVDREGVDPLVEHDSHGQLIHAVAESFRFTRDGEFLRGLWPHCAMAARYIESLRDTRKTVEFQTLPRRACFGLLPESVSHEGYLAQPVHSYWDDFWALRGLRDAAFLAGELTLDDEAARWSAAAADLADAIAASMRTVMEERCLVTVPASVEWADFDPTAVAGAISLVGAGDLFPADALKRTFDQYMAGVRARCTGTVAWNNYSPYEVRIVGALVRMGRRDEANELLQSLLGDRRPVSWRQWPEIVWRDADAPAHLGDLPHCWIGAEYVIALRSMLVYEREVDGALVIGAGLRREWLDAPGGIDIRGIATWYGTINVTIRSESSARYLVTIGGDAHPPGGFVAELPEQSVVVNQSRPAG